jgi:hypothetical protein
MKILQFSHTEYELLLVSNNDKKQIMLHGMNHVEKFVRIFVLPNKQGIDKRHNFRIYWGRNPSLSIAILYLSFLPNIKKNGF